MTSIIERKAIPSTPERRVQEPSPFKPQRKVPVSIDAEGNIQLVGLSPGHHHPATYEWANKEGIRHEADREKLYVGGTGDLQARVSKYRSDAKRFVALVSQVKELPPEHSQRILPLVRNLNPLLVNLASHPDSFTFAFHELSPDQNVGDAEETRLQHKKKQGYSTYNQRAGGGGLRSNTSEKTKEKRPSEKTENKENEPPRSSKRAKPPLLLRF